MWDRLVDDGKEGDGEQPELEADPGDIFASEVPKAVENGLVGGENGMMGWDGHLGREQQSLDALIRKADGTGAGFDNDLIILRDNREASLPSLEEADVMIRQRNGRVKDGGAGIRRLAVGNVIAHLEKQLPTGALEKGHVLAGNPTASDNAICESAVFDIERKQKGLHNALHKAVDETEQKKTSCKPVQRDARILVVG